MSLDCAARMKGGPVFKQPLHGEVGARFGGIADALLRGVGGGGIGTGSAHADVRVRALGEQELNELQVIDVRFRGRIVADFDVAVIRRDVERIPATVVLEVRIRAAVEAAARPVCNYGSASR